MPDVSFAIGGQNAEFLAALQGCRDAMNQTAAAMKQGMAGLSGSVNEVSKSLSGGLGGALDEVKEKMTAAFEFTGLTVGFEAIEKLSSLFEVFGEKARTIGSGSDVLGISAEQFQAMQVAAEDAGVGTDTLVHGTERLVSILNEARQGSGAAVEKLRDLGVTLEQIADPGYTTNDLLETLHERLNNTGTAQSTMNELLKDFGSRAALVAEALKAYDGSAQAVEAVMGAINGLTGEQTKDVAETTAEWNKLGTAIANTAEKAVLYITSMKYMGSDLPAPPQAKTGDASAGAAAFASQMQAVAAQSDDANRKMLKNEMQSISAGVEAYKQGTAERLAALQVLAAETAQYYGADTDKAREANERVLVAQREYTEAAEAAQNNLTRAIDRDNLDASTYLTQLFRAQTTEAEKQWDEQARAHAAYIKKVEAEQDQMNKGLSRDGDEKTKRITDEWNAMANGISGSFTTAMRSVMSGSESAGQAAKKAFASMAESMIGSLVKVGVQMVANAAISKLTGQAAAKSNIQANAAQAAAGAMASAAAIPYVGWMLAPIEGAAVYAAALAFPSAKGGFDIPAGDNPLTQLHEKEMVLPRKYADGFRNLIESGGGGGDTHNYGGIHMTGSNDIFKQLAQPHTARRVADALTSAYRRGARPK